MRYSDCDNVPTSVRLHLCMVRSASATTEDAQARGTCNLQLQMLLNGAVGVLHTHATWPVRNQTCDRHMTRLMVEDEHQQTGLQG